MPLWVASSTELRAFAALVPAPYLLPPLTPIYTDRAPLVEGEETYWALILCVGPRLRA
jgi:hypothetical protein